MHAFRQASNALVASHIAGGSNMKMNRMNLVRTTTVAAAVAAALGAMPAQSLELVSTIYGVYDAQACGVNASCLSGSVAPGYANDAGASNVGYALGYDTPTLFINNNTGFAFTNVQLTLTAYQGINAGSVTNLSLGAVNGGSSTIAANTLYALVWDQGGAGAGNAIPAGGTTSANLFTFDYDDMYAGNSGAPACFGPGSSGGSFCEHPGNFDVTFTAQWDGLAISAVFSPDNTQGPGNAAGAFVGWEGMDPTGLGETVYDNHTGSVAGVLANIYVGTPNQITGVPEPATLGLLGAGLGALGLARRRRKSA
jgi:PEP-CTERM motif